MIDQAKSTNTIESYLRDIKKFHVYLEENNITGIETVNRQTIQLYLAELSERGYAVSTTNRIISSLRNFFIYLVKEEKIEDNPTALIQSAKNRQKLPKALSAKQVEAILDAPDTQSNNGIRDRAILELMYATGLRVSELTELELSGIHLDLGFIQTVGKGNKERLIPLGDEAVYWMRKYMDEVDPTYRKKAKGIVSVVFLTQRGNKFTRQGI